MQQDYQKIFKKLLDVKKNAYVPYSNFHVSAICKANNEFFYGVNIENSAYPSGSCAERSAISAAISKGNKEISEIYILTDSTEIGTPCGMCRQFMSEFMKDDSSKIVVFNIKGQYKVY